jgi:(4-(4-[2-(gamma-L-glutamylamino)ethyl]phenoxymethyl)furan-2-yl)methanamine synthase
MAITAGYDVGGAHLKVALAEDGRTLAARQIACPLWKGLDALDAAFAEAAPLLARADSHAATMTGELCELFPDRPSGVTAIIDRLVSLLGPDVRIWLGPRGFGSADEARADPMSAASTNFLASAALVARRVPDALLIDMGSTTTDIIPIAGGRPAPRGLTDADRLVSGELVYTGLTRTDVSVVAQRALFRGREQRLAAGGFANMADVRRILGELAEGVDQHSTLDGRGKSAEDSVARFARCFGRDAGDASVDDWRISARDIADRQMSDVRAAVTDVLAAAELPSYAPIVAAGIGAPQVETLARMLGRETLRFGALAGTTPDCEEWATRCAPAVAVALLAQGA